MGHFVRVMRKVIFRLYSATMFALGWWTGWIQAPPMPDVKVLPGHRGAISSFLNIRVPTLGRNTGKAAGASCDLQLRGNKSSGIYVHIFHYNLSAIVDREWELEPAAMTTQVLGLS